MTTPPQKQLLQKWMRSQPLAGRSSHWTTALADQQFFLGLGLLTLFHFWLSTFLPPAEDELYYWTWAKDLGWSYFDHPPLVAYLIALSTKVFGDSLFGIRFFACLSGLASLFILSLFTEHKMMVTLLMGTPLFFLGSVLMTPDIPLVFFWLCYLTWLISCNRVLAEWSGDPVARVYRASPVSYLSWALGGLLLGLGFLGKYTMFLAIPCSFVVLWSGHRSRAWLTGYALHLAVAGIVILPIFIFNAQHHFISFQFQWGNAMAGGGFSFAKLFEFLGSQVCLVGALPFLLFPWVVLNRGELSDEPRLHACFYFFALPLVFFLFQSLRTKLEANWAIVAYLSFWPIAQSLHDRSSFKSLGQGLIFVSFLFPLALSAILIAHEIVPLRFIPPQKDRMTRLRRQFELSQAVASQVRARKDSEPLYTPNYQWTAYFRYRGIHANQLFPSGRNSQYTLAPVNPCGFKVVLFFADTMDPGAGLPGLSCFSRRDIISQYPIEVRGVEVARYFLFKYSR